MYIRECIGVYRIYIYLVEGGCPKGGRGTTRHTMQLKRHLPKVLKKVLTLLEFCAKNRGGIVSRGGVVPWVTTLNTPQSWRVS